MKNPIIQYWRILACLSIVMHHTLCAFLGDWPPTGYSLADDLLPLEVQTMSRLTKAFGLTSFTYISGLVLLYSKGKYSFAEFLWRKLKRIIFPALLFGFIYWLMFPSLMENPFPAPINGTHLWYLPMIFLCIMITSVHFYMKKNAYLVVGGIYLLAIICAKYSSFRTINEFVHFFPVFYIAYLVNCIIISKEEFTKALIYQNRRKKICSILSLFFLFLFLAIILYQIGSLRYLFIACLWSAIYFSLYKLTCRETPKGRKGEFYKVVNVLDRNTFPVYILHQFIINIWLIFGTGFLKSNNIYVMILLVWVTTFVGALSISEMYNRIVMYIKEKHEM